VLSVFLRYLNEAAENDEDYRSGTENIGNPVVSSPDMFERIPIQLSATCHQNTTSWRTLNARVKSLNYNEFQSIYNVKPMIFQRDCMYILNLLSNSLLFN